MNLNEAIATQQGWTNVQRLDTNNFELIGDPPPDSRYAMWKRQILPYWDLNIEDTLKLFDGKYVIKLSLTASGIWMAGSLPIPYTQVWLEFTSSDPSIARALAKEWARTKELTYDEL